MRAVVLVGGFGTRLRPLTLTRPKQMLPILDRPMIEHVLGHLADHGVAEAVLALGYRPDAFIDAYPDGRCAGVTLRYAVEPEPLDTAGAVRFAAHHVGLDERFLVVNGDVLTDLDLSALVAFHEEHGAEGTVALHKVADPSAFGVVPTDAHGRVEAFVEKPPRDEAPTDLINAGTYVLETSVLDRIAGDRKVSIEREVFPAMVADATLYAMAGDTYWIDAGTPTQYLAAQLDLVDGLRGPPLSGVAPSASVAPSADVRRSIVGPETVVAAGAVVFESVVLGGARVADGSHLERSLVGFDAVIGEGADLIDCVVGDGVDVAADTHLSDARVAPPE